MTASTIRNSDIATKNVPTAVLLKLRVTMTVKATLDAAEITAPARLTTPPLATPREAGPAAVGRTPVGTARSAAPVGRALVGAPQPVPPGSALPWSVGALAAGGS